MGKVLQAQQTMVSGAEDPSPISEREVCMSFSDVFDNYNDALILWRAELSSSKKLYASDAGKIIAGKAELAIAKKYGLPVEKIKLFTSDEVAEALPPRSVSNLLTIAGVLVEKMPTSETR